MSANANEGLTKRTSALVRRGLSDLVKLRKARVLVCDDEEAIVEVIVRILESAGYEVRWTVNSLEAIEIAQQFHPHVALIGEIMPRLDGFKVALEKTRRLGNLWVILAACFAVVGLVVAGVWHLRSSRTPQIDSIAVLPFTNVNGDANTDYLSDGITESLIGSLAHVPELKVKSRNSVFHYKGKDVDMQKVGSELGVSALVSGRVVPRGDNIEVSAELTDVRDNTEIWGQHYSGKSTEIISLEQQIASDLADKLRSKLSTSEKQLVAKQGTQNPEAYEFYLKGRYYWNKRTLPDFETAISYFNQAIAKDPGYALAYSGLADTYTVLPSYGANPKGCQEVLWERSGTSSEFWANDGQSLT